MYDREEIIRGNLLEMTDGSESFLHSLNGAGWKNYQNSLSLEGISGSATRVYAIVNIKSGLIHVFQNSTEQTPSEEQEEIGVSVAWKVKSRNLIKRAARGVLNAGREHYRITDWEPLAEPSDISREARTTIHETFTRYNTDYGFRA